METSKSIPKNKIKNKKGQQNEKFASSKIENQKEI